MSGINFSSKFLKYFQSIITGYNHKKYWERREKIINPDSKIPLILKYYYFFYIKRIDAKLHCSFGTNIGSGAIFETPPILFHGPSGIVIGHNVIIGKNIHIAQQVTIEHPKEKPTVIGDNVLLGAGSKVRGGVTIGNNVKIGMNAVVIQDIPDNATVVLNKPRIIIKK